MDNSECSAVFLYLASRCQAVVKDYLNPSWYISEISSSQHLFT